MNLWHEDLNPSGDPCILLIPGSGSSGEMWPSLFVDPLVSAGCRVVRFDPRDTGRSPGTGADTPYDLYDMADDVAELAAGLGARRIVVVGYSLGGPVATCLIARNPRLAQAAVLISSPARPDRGFVTGDQAFALPDGDPTEFFARAMGPHDAQDEAAMADHVRSAAVPLVTVEAVVKHVQAALSTIAPTDEELAQAGVPTLLVHGECDAAVPIDNALSGRDNLGWPLHTLPTMGHAPTPALWEQLAEVVLVHARHAEVVPSSESAVTSR